MGGRKASEVPSQYTPRTSLVISRSYALLHDYGYTQQDVADVVASCNHCEDDINETITRMVVEGSEGRAWKTIQKEVKPAAANKSRRSHRDEQQKVSAPRNGPMGRAHDRQPRGQYNGPRGENIRDGSRKRVDAQPAESTQEPAAPKAVAKSVPEQVTPSVEPTPVEAAPVTRKAYKPERTTWAQKISGGGSKPQPESIAAPNLSKQPETAAVPAPAIDPCAVAPKTVKKSSWVARARGGKTEAPASQPQPLAPKEEEPTVAPPVIEIEKTVIIEASIIPSSPAAAAPIIDSAVLPPPVEAPPAPVEPAVTKPVILKTLLTKPAPPPTEVAGGIEHMSSAAKPVVRTKILTRRDDISTVTIPSYVPDRASLEMAGGMPERAPIHADSLPRHQVPAMQRPVEQYMPQHQAAQVPYYYSYDRMRYAPPPQQEYYAPPPAQSHYGRLPQMMGRGLEEDVPPPHMDQTRYYQPAYHHYANNLPPYDNGGARQTPEYDQNYSVPPHAYRPPGEMTYNQYGAPTMYGREDGSNRRENHYGAQYGMPPIFMTAAPQVDERSGRYGNYTSSGSYQAPPPYNAPSSSNLFKY